MTLDQHPSVGRAVSHEKKDTVARDVRVIWAQLICRAKPSVMLQSLPLTELR